MCTYYDEKYGQTYSTDGYSSYYDSKYGQTYSTDGYSSYYDDKYGQTYSTDGYSSYYDDKYGQTYSTDGYSSYYDSKYGTNYSTSNYTSYYSSDDNNSSSSYYSDDSGGCYISTACIRAKHFSDDCFELMILRKYRDQLVQTDEDVRRAVQDYYIKAPDIVSKINDSPNKNMIYDFIYKELVVASISYLVKGDYKNAVNQYRKVFEQLKSTYHIE